VSYGELEGLFQQFFALVEATIRLPPGSERRAAFKDVRDCGERIDQIAALLFKTRSELISKWPPRQSTAFVLHVITQEGRRL
jgi:hypothetical protein